MVYDNFCVQPVAVVVVVVVVVVDVVEVVVVVVVAVDVWETQPSSKTWWQSVVIRAQMDLPLNKFSGEILLKNRG